MEKVSLSTEQRMIAETELEHCIEDECYLEKLIYELVYIRNIYDTHRGAIEAFDQAWGRINKGVEYQDENNNPDK